MTALPQPPQGLRDWNSCPIRDVLDHVGSRWSLLILFQLRGRTLRFTELKREIGDISQRMLTQTLRILERDGLVSRHIYPTIPPRVDYALTDLGTSLLEPMGELLRWAVANHDRIRAARSQIDQISPAAE